MSGDDHARRSEGLKRALRRPWKLTDAARMSADAFAERYAHSRGLSYEITAGTPRGTWFLGAVWAKRSHSFLRGRLAGGADGLLFYPEKLVGGGRVAVREGWTAARYEVPTARELAQGIACVPRLGPIWGGRVKLVSAIPPGLAVTTTGDAGFDGTYEVGVASDHDRAGVSALFDADFTAWMRGLPFGKLGEQSTRIELCAGVLCVYTKGMLTTAEELITGKPAANVSTVNGLRPHGITANGLTPNGLPANGLPSNGLSAKELTVEELPAEELTAEQVTAEKLTPEQVTAEQVTAEELTAEEPAVGAAGGPGEPDPVGPAL